MSELDERMRRFYDRTSGPAAQEKAAEAEAARAKAKAWNDEAEAYIEKKRRGRKFYIERRRVVYGDRTLNGVPIGREATMRHGPFGSWTKAKEARGGHGGRIVIES